MGEQPTQPMKKILLFIAVTFLLKLSGYGQNNHTAISIDYIQGLKAFSSFNTPFQDRYYGARVGFHIYVDSAGWAKKLSIKDAEFQASYLNLQNIVFNGTGGPTGLLGSHYAVTAGINILLVKWGEISWVVSPGGGIVYAPKNFYTTSNQNFIIGSALNVLLYARTKVVVPVSPAISLEGGVGISHTSNGSLSFPNDGFDNISAFAGVMAGFNKTKSRTRKMEFEAADSKFEIAATFGGRSEEKTGYTKNPKTNIGYYADTAIQRQTPLIYQANLLINYKYRLNSLFSIMVGTDAAYYFKTFSWNNFFRTYEGPFTSFGHFSLGVTAGVNLSIGRLTFSPGLGYFVLDRFLYPDTRFYTTLSVKYFVTTNVALQVRTIINDYSGAGISVGF